MNLTIRPSKVAAWLGCERQGVYEGARIGIELRRRERQQHVATWIGKAVHARLALESEPEPDGLLVYDATTPSRKIAENQIGQMTRALRIKLERLGWRALAREVQVGPARWPHWPHNTFLEGTSDLLCVDAEGKGVLVDVKTSKEIVKAWLQLGCYVLAYEHTECEIPGAPKFVERVAVAHCPRPRSVLELPIAEIYTQPAGDMVKDAWIALNRIIENIKHPEAAPAARTARTAATAITPTVASGCGSISHDESCTC